MEEQNDLVQQRLQLDDIIEQLVRQRKDLEKQVKDRRKASLEAKSELKKMRDKKSKSEKSVIADIENLLIEHNITAASYHGGKLHGVEC
jgi:RNase H-fold protein (predicted Holliday junction resolvase)